MEYLLLGKSSLKISRIGFGCMSLGAENGNAGKILQQAVSMGINYFDTADMYQRGLNEELVGKAFKGIRDQVILASKVGNECRPDGSGWDWNPTKKYMLEAVEKSLQRLQTDYIDLYQLHGGTIADPIDETIEAFELLKAQGKIRYYGISSIRPNVIREYIRRSHIVSVMMQYSLLDRRPEEEMLDLLQKNKIGVLARGSLARGLLVSKPATAFLNYTLEQVAEAARVIKEVSSDARSATASAIRFVIDHPAILSAIVGIRTNEQLKNAVDSVYAKPLTELERHQLSTTLPIHYYEEHR